MADNSSSAKIAEKILEQIRIQQQQAIPPHLQGGWSVERYTNPLIPMYIPPECFVIEGGRLLNGILARCKIHDTARIGEEGTQAAYFHIAGPSIEPEYDPSTGARTNTHDKILMSRKLEAMKELRQMLAQHKEILSGRAAEGKSTLGGGGEVTRKYPFSERQLELFGTVLGGRGEIHQEIVRDSGCRNIEFAGRGITNLDKKINIQRGSDAERKAKEAPHARIIAPTEAAANKAIEMIEWLLSDDPEAEKKREANRRRVAILNGTYDPTLDGEYGSKRGGFGNNKAGDKRLREEATTEVEDPDLAEFDD